MLLLLQSYGSDAEAVAASFLFAAVIFGFFPLVGFLAFGREMLRKLRVAKLEEVLQPPARIGNENLLTSKTMRAGATR
jgi:hypothetical protein